MPRYFASRPKSALHAPMRVRTLKNGKPHTGRILGTRYNPTFRKHLYCVRTDHDQEVHEFHRSEIEQL